MTNGAGRVRLYISFLLKLQCGFQHYFCLQREALEKAKKRKQKIQLLLKNSQDSCSSVSYPGLISLPEANLYNLSRTRCHWSS